MLSWTSLLYHFPPSCPQEYIPNHCIHASARPTVNSGGAKAKNDKTITNNIKLMTGRRRVYDQCKAFEIRNRSQRHRGPRFDSTSSRRVTKIVLSEPMLTTSRQRTINPWSGTRATRRMLSIVRQQCGTGVHLNGHITLLISGATKASAQQGHATGGSLVGPVLVMAEGQSRE